jgi:hypothetical protein
VQIATQIRNIAMRNGIEQVNTMQEEIVMVNR